MFFHNRQGVDNLKIVGEPDLFAVLPALFQSPVIIATAVTEAVAGAIKHDPRYNNQIQSGNRHPVTRYRLRDGVNALDQIVQAGDLDEFEMFAYDTGESHSLAGIESMPANHVCQDLVVDGAVQGQQAHFGIQLRIKKPLLYLPAELVALVLR
jgi:hypothetical protein